MKSIGCLTIIVLIGLGILLLGKSQNISEEQQGQYVGEKVHRGYNKIKRVVEGAKEGWKKAPDEEQEEEEDDQSDKPAQPKGI